MFNNLLPRDGMVFYFDPILTEIESGRLFENLMKNIEWKQDKIKMFGKEIITKRKIGWYGSSPFKYKYSGTVKIALPWTTDLDYIKKKVEIISGERFNSCLLNYYQDGSVGMGWHSDDEKELIPNGTIASISLGSSRRFLFKHKVCNDRIECLLESGSVLLMKGEVQKYWSHSLPKMLNVKKNRINLTFRNINEAII